MRKGSTILNRKTASFPALATCIDRNTGGIVIAAKNAQSLRILNQKVKDRELVKLYLCLVHGVPEPKSATLRDFLLKDSSRNQVRIYRNQVPGSKTIITRYKTLETNGKLSLLEVESQNRQNPSDPRSHGFLRTSSVGDTKYGTNAQNKGLGYSYQALYAYKLRFAFQTDGGILSYLDGREFCVENVPFAKEIAKR